jgi:hypothetical protein
MHTRVRRLLLFRPNCPFFALSDQTTKNTPKSTNFDIVDFQHVTKKMQKKCKNIWSVQKKAVPLHPLSPKKRGLPRDDSIDL